MSKGDTNYSIPSDPVSGLAGQPPGSEIQFSQATLDAYLLDFMRNLYPDISAYQQGNLLYYPESEDLPISTAKETEVLENVYQIETNSEQTGYDRQGVIKLKPGELIRVSPVGEEEELEDLIDDTFSFFVEDEELDDIVEAPEPENDIFIALKSTELNDCHDMYLNYGPSSRTLIGSNTFVVLYIDQGVARPIPNYQTLEVMLVERQIGYESISTITEEEIALYKIYSQEDNGCLTGPSNYALREMPDRIQQWNPVIRFKSLYKPVAPFVRDPADYYTPNKFNIFDTEYDTIVYEKQTAIEKLRAQFEGTMVAFNVTFDTVDNIPNQIVDADLDSVRVMTYGYWKKPENLEILGPAYNEYKELGQVAPSENRSINWLNKFNTANALTVFQGGDGGAFVTGWNNFPHIVGVNTLDRVEYEEYFNSCAGDPFDKDYLTPYEPVGSSKYYVAATSAQLRQEALASLEELADQYDEQQSLFALRDDTREQLSTLQQAINSTIDSLPTYQDFEQSQGVAAVRERANDIAKDLQRFWHADSKYWNYYRKDNVKGRHKNIFKLMDEEMRNSHEKICMQAFAEATLRVYNCCAPVDNESVTRGCGLSHEKFFREAELNVELIEKSAEAGEILDDMFEQSLGVDQVNSYVPGGIQIEFNLFENLFENIGSAFANFFADIKNAFTRVGVSNLYKNKANVRGQISSWGIGTSTWGVVAEARTPVPTAAIVGQFNQQFLDDRHPDDLVYSGTAAFPGPSIGVRARVRYSGSPIFGEYLTPYDESIENLLGSEDFAETRAEIHDLLIGLRSDVNSVINEIDEAGEGITSQALEEFISRYEQEQVEFDQATTSIVTNTSTTMHAALDVIAKRWIAKSHNTVNYIRKKFMEERSKWNIEYNVASKAIVRKYFPNLAGDHFKRKKTDFINYDEI